MRQALLDVRRSLSNCLNCIRVTIGLFQLLIALVRLARLAKLGFRSDSGGDSVDNRYSVPADSQPV